MKNIVLAAAFAATATLAHADPKFSQAFDAEAGAFLPQVTTGAVAVGPAAVVSADVVIKVKINVASSIGSTEKIYCQGSIGHSAVSAAGPVSYTEAATSVATRSSTTAASCSVRIPFLWSKADTTQKLLPALVISVGEKRYLMHTLPMMAIPASGKTVTVSYTARL